jgi:hypothetical protein
MRAVRTGTGVFSGGLSLLSFVQLAAKNRQKIIIPVPGKKRVSFFSWP